MKYLQLLGTSGCHLCEQAEAILAEILATGVQWQIELIDIAESDALLESYGERIPVLRDIEAERDLAWPFDASVVQGFVGRRPV